MQIKLGSFTVAIMFVENVSGKQLSFVFSIDETNVTEACATWLIFSNDDMPVFAGVSVGRWNETKRNLRSVDITLRKGKWRWNKG